MCIFCTPSTWATTAPDWMGDWEVEQVFVQRDGLTHPDDPRYIGRRLRISADEGILFLDEMGWRTHMDMVKGTIWATEGGADCHLEPMPQGQAQPMRALFAQEHTPRPAALHDLLKGHMRDYRLCSLGQQPVRLLQLRCSAEETDPPWHSSWVAMTADALLFAQSDDILLRLQRPPRTPSPAQRAFCAKARSASDKAICAHRELWRMYSGLGPALAQVQDYPSPARSKLRFYVEKFTADRQACEGDPHCLVNILSLHMGVLVDDWAPLKPVRCQSKPGTASQPGAAVPARGR